MLVSELIEPRIVQATWEAGPSVVPGAVVTVAVWVGQPYRSRMKMSSPGCFGVKRYLMTGESSSFYSDIFEMYFD